MAMHDLLKKGYHVCILEASGIAGGRIATIAENDFNAILETGAEFIHGKLPLTLKLLKQAGISYVEVEGEMYGVKKGKWKNDEHNEYWDEFMSKLGKLKTDTTIHQFLNDHFPEPKYIALRQEVQRFAEGFNLAEISRASVLSVKNEWKDIEKKQFRVEGGYGRLVNFLLERCVQLDAMIYYNSFVNKIEYNDHSVSVYTSEGKKLEGNKLIITVSVGILQAGIIAFDPPPGDHLLAIQGLGFGTVIKFLLKFKTNFWQSFKDDIGFILSDEEVPTWWTQFPKGDQLLTGWMGGTMASEKIFWTDDQLLEVALKSLSSIFQMPVTEVTSHLDQYKIINWQNNPNVKGGYSFNTLSSDAAKKVLAKPINKTIYFAGEAVNQGKSQGTVESALQSGKEVAALLIKEYR